MWRLRATVQVCLLSGGSSPRYARGVTGPRRVLITWDYGASGIWWVLTKEEKEAPAPSGRWTGTPPPGWHDRPRPWSDRLSTALLDDLQAWNDAWICDGADPWALQERGRELAARVQDELRTDGWEVLYQMGSQIVRVHPPGSWPVESWERVAGLRPGRTGIHQRPAAQRALVTSLPTDRNGDSNGNSQRLTAAVGDSP